VASGALFWDCGRAERRGRTSKSLGACIRRTLRHASRSQLQRQIASVCSVTFQNSVHNFYNNGSELMCYSNRRSQCCPNAATVIDLNLILPSPRINIQFK
jgi:hypothetical protein